MKLDGRLWTIFWALTILDSWVFSGKIEPGKRLFDLSGVQTRQSGMGQLLPD